MKSKCDYLILSDSIIRRIHPKRFTPKAATMKRFIRGGAATCSNFVEKYSSNFETKNILLHVGIRDLQNNGIQNHEFAKLFEVCSQTWKDANIYMSLIMRRRDKSYDIILDANKQIRQILQKFPNIRIIEQFEPSDRMFHYDVHLNNYGISAIVNHLKIALNLSPSFMSNRRKSGQKDTIS